MNNRLIKPLLFAASSTLLLTSCGGNNSSYETPGVVTNPGVISQKHFSLLTADINPAVIDATTGDFTKTDVELTVYIADRDDHALTDAHTIYFKTEYGIIDRSCVTKDGECSVTWSAIERPVAGKGGSDGTVSITAYTIGEEAFTDTNGNGIFDDGDAGFDDLEEPFVDFNEDGVYTTTVDKSIDVVNAYDTDGVNGQHDLGDSRFNGGNCTHSSLCSPITSITVFDDVRMNLVTNIPLERTIGGNVIGLVGTGLQLLNNSETLSIAANGPYTFPTTVTDGSTYAVSVTAQPTGPGQICTVANATGGPVSANVTTVDVTCVTNTYTIGGGAITNLLGTGLVLQNNGGDNLTIANTDSSYTFATAVDDGSTYAVAPLTQPSSPNQTCVIANASGTVSAANVTNADISCTTTQYTIGGTITATSIPATETIIIQNNLGDDYTINSGDTSFVFATAIDDGTAYGVTIATFPTSKPGPGGCTVTNASGTVAGSNVTNVSIDCP